LSDFGWEREVRAGRLLLGIVAIVVVLGIGFVAFAWRSEIAAVEPPEELDAGLVARGADLAAVGNCIACHTVPGQKSFAGGLPLPTPFGTIYSTNVTPDAETGIGRWSEAAFRRALREGVDREGRHLYPAFPYDHFTLATDADVSALYAYMMTRQPVAATAPENELAFPFNIRMLLAGWKALYLEEGAFRPDPDRSEEWNRGAYLAEGLGHCGGCHTPRNALGAEDRDRHFSGGEAEGWRAYAIDAASPAPVPWDRESLAFYLRHGWHEAHGVSRGPMAEVTGNLGSLPDADVAAIATYVASVMGEPSHERRERAQALLDEVAKGPGVLIPAADSMTTRAAIGDDAGARIYASTCAPCHESGRPPPYGGLSFALSTAVNAASPQNIVNVTLFGLPAADGEASAVMPGFAGVLSDADVAALLGYMRERFGGGRPAWEGVTDMVRATRTGEYEVTIRPADGIERGPANVGAED
jgi:mono/diheme cytochrome c family protein